MRPCGECQLCCKLFPVPVLEKPAGAWCRHSCAAGCAIHASRPEVCRQYDCYWRDHDDLPDNCRPDRIGVVVTEAGNVSVGKEGDSPHLPERPAGCCAQMGTVPFFRPRGDLPGRFRRCRGGPAAARLLAHFLRRGFAALVIHGLMARTEFDRARYPGVSAEDIEAALLYEFSQDADELRRLGAVDDSYQRMTFDEARAACRK